MSEELDVSQLRTIGERCKLEGAVGYIAYLQDLIHKGKFKTVEDISRKIGNDGEIVSSALAEHFKEELKIAGWICGLFEELRIAEKEAEKE